MPQSTGKRQYESPIVTTGLVDDSYQALYRERQTVVRAYDYLSFACKSIPVHFIYGGMRDYL